MFPTDAFENVLAPYLGPKEPEFAGLELMIADFIYRASIGHPLVNDDYFAAEEQTLDLA